MTRHAPLWLFLALLTAWCWRLNRPYDAYRDANSLNQHPWALNMARLGFVKSEGVPVVETKPPSWRAYLEYKYQDSVFFTMHKTKPMVQMVHYPPGLTWTSVLAFTLFRSTDPWAARLAPIGFIAAGWWALFALVRRRMGVRTALWVGLLFGGAPVVVTFCQHLDYVPLGVGAGLVSLWAWLRCDENPTAKNKGLFLLCWFVALWYGWYAVFLGVLPLLGEWRRGRGWLWRLLPYGVAPVLFGVILVWWFSRVGGGAALEDLKTLFTKRTVGNAVEVGGQFLPIPWRLWFTVALARPFVLVSPLVVLLLPVLRLVRKKNRPVLWAFLRGGWKDDAIYLEVCLWAWGLCPMIVFRQVAFVHGYTLMYLAPALAFSVGRRVAALGTVGQALALAVWLAGAWPGAQLMNHYLESPFSKNLANMVDRMGGERTVVLTDLYDEGIWSWVYYHTDQAVLYNVNSVQRLKKALAVIPRGYRVRFLTLPLPTPERERQTALWGQLMRRHARFNHDVFTVFDLQKPAPACRLGPRQRQPLQVWGEKLNLWRVRARAGSDKRGRFLDYELTLNAKRPMMTDLVLYTHVPQTGQTEAWQPVDGLLTTSHWPTGRDCVKQHRRLYLPRRLAPRRLELLATWCDADRRLCVREGQEKMARDRPQWTPLAWVKTPPRWRGKRLESYPPREMDNLVGIYQHNLALPFLKAFQLDPILNLANEGIEAGLKGDYRLSYALKSKAIHRHRLVLLIEAMIPYALTSLVQGLGMEAIKDAVRQGNTLGAVRHGVGMAWYLVPTYDMLHQAALGLCRQTYSPGCSLFLNSAARTMPSRMAELGLMAQSLGKPRLARSLWRKAPPSVSRSAVQLLWLADQGNLSKLRDQAERLRAKGELVPALAVVRRQLSPMQLLTLYERLGPVVTRRMLRSDAYYYLDTGNEAGFKAILAYYENRQDRF